ncbi:hypothetical protein [Novosphingobium sp. PASSN1]|uniref:hypothetical protein n=1 Tax=Novosphingobium sp. PASSN1 TaxID=2015561 RepID=UPI000BDAF7AF|nr:hypothetical protein [Novosphingobium sp. PASSN1]OYU36179.1 MAG: hypothetical protein CFE35_07950 [Novosphingobium sp. PASSN1]
MSRLVKAGLLTIAAGWAPLLYEIQFGPADSNPLGLGLLMVGATAIGLLLLVIAGLKALFPKAK